MFEDITRVHIVGIGGIGVSALAKFFLTKGVRLTGSDLEGSFIIDDLKKLGAVISIGHKDSNLPPKVDLLIYSDAVPPENSERVKAVSFKIKQLSYSQVLGDLSRLKPKTIAVSGNKGKTTTTAMLAQILEEAGLDPTAVVGSYVNNWQSNFREGDSDYLVIEGDEWRDHMQALSPWAIVLTNIEPDHLDYFGTFENEIASFQKYILKLPAQGLYVLNADDPVTATLKRPACRCLSFGIKNSSDLKALERQVQSGFQSFILEYKGQKLGRFILKLPGLFNVYNALAASAVALEIGIGVDVLRQALANFKGTWRRFQVIGDYKGAKIISDYAHHPTAVAAATEAAKEFYPGQRVVVAFQPHHHHRTKSLFNEFVKSFDQADLLILSEIYKVEGRDNISDKEVSSLDLVKAVRARDKERGVLRKIEFSRNLDEVRHEIDEHVESGDVVLVMGAGDIYKVAEQLPITKN